jgi:hypothetical protein
LSESDPTARQLIDDASGMTFGEPRRVVLQRALKELGCEESAAADFEACAVALAMLAQQDARYLSDAKRALERAVSQGVQSNWILLHLAEALLSAGEFSEALRAASSVRQDYFDEQDLHWRSVRMDEIRAVALLRLGRLSEGVEVAMKVCAELARHGDSEDLAPPTLLVRTALLLIAPGSPAGAVEAGCKVLRCISDSIELESWFPPELVEELGRGLSVCE